MTGAREPPLIVTARLDAKSFARFDALRREHFPPALNHLSAHLTLFHHLPGDRLGGVVEAMVDAAAAAPSEVEVVGLRSLGRGVAYDLRSPGLVAVRAGVASRFREALTPQDAQGFRPHVTVQNKVPPEAARALKAELEAGFTPWTARAEALQLWRYLGGPWELEGEWPFRG